MASKYTFVQNDTGPAIVETIKDPAGVVVNLTGATVKFHMRRLSATSAKVNRAATIENAAGGVVRHTWILGDLDTVGTFNCEWEITFAAGAVQTTESFQIEVKSEVA